MSEGSVQEFLDLEAQAAELVRELDALKAAKLGHRDAQESLAQASQSVQELTSALRSAAESVRIAGATLREIGTPQLLASSQETRRVMDETLAPKLVRIESGMDKLPARIGQVETQMGVVTREQAALTERLAQLQTVTMRLGIGTLVVAIAVLLMLIAR